MNTTFSHAKDEEKNMLTKAEIHEFLKNLGIKKSDTVLVHTSMKAIGEVEGGCDGLIDGFTSYLTEGLFLVPTHTWANVNESQPIYDVRATIPCIGALPTTAAFRKDGVRSLHPTHSITGFGKRAEEFLRGEENATSPCFPGGAWARLYDEDTKILMLGVGLDKLTYIHAVDEMIDLPNRLSAEKRLTVIDKNGGSREIVYRSHSRATSQYFVNYQKPFDYYKALEYSTLGNAPVISVNAKLITEILKKIWLHAEWDICSVYKEIPENWYI